MNITLIGPGTLPIPPEGWGGVESLIWDFNNELKARGHEVTIINNPNTSEIIDTVNSLDSDFVHLHYDVFAHIMPYIKCKNKAVTSHYPYLEHDDKNLQYRWIFQDINTSDSHVICLSEGIKKAFIRHGHEEKNISVVPCGINAELFQTREVKYPDRSIYLAKIEDRKKQFALQNPIFNIDFAGPIADNRFHHQNKNYLGSLTKEQIYETLTDWANLILLSDGECHARVCIEAMSAGLGVVISEQAAANLDTSKPFISVIPNDKLSDGEYLKNVLEENRKQSIANRAQIREYCISEFGWDNIISKYTSVINR
tara:strand:- start:26762 stop:27697 length:936 start_codon:yes stop_codon:yes gene_type:complete